MTSDISPPAHDGSSNAPDWEAIARFLVGESSSEEATKVEQWLDANPGDRELVARLDEALLVDARSDVDVEAALARVHSQMADQLKRPSLTIERGRGPSRRFALVIGSLLAAAAVTGVAFTMRSSPPAAAPAKTLSARTYTTKIGQRDSVVLTDGSRVLLGPDSRLVVPSEYGSTSRSVELRGDGYFDVRHDSGKPFAVRVGEVLIEDVGTTFTVESDAGDTTSVAVVTGSVRLRAGNSAAGSGVLLAAGDRGSIDGGGSATAQRHSVRDEDTAWTTGRLAFRDASLTRVAGEIHRWYGVTLHVADSSLLNRHVTASFAGEPVDQVLKIVALTLGAQIERQGDSAIVTATPGSRMER
jgi:transmembrane sensor